VATDKSRKIGGVITTIGSREEAAHVQLRSTNLPPERRNTTQDPIGRETSGVLHLDFLRPDGTYSSPADMTGTQPLTV